MINRVLIRTKVVQLLYSYLLTRSEFKINEAPVTASRDQKYAHSLYIDFLLLILELSGYSVKLGEKAPLSSADRKLQANKVAKALSENDEIRAIIAKNNNDIERFNVILPSLHEKIVSSAVFKDYAKRKKITLADDVKLWTTIFETIIDRSHEITDLLRKNGDYSSQGFHWAVRDLCSTLRSYVDAREFYDKANKDLIFSLDKAYQLYLSIFRLIIDITQEYERRVETAKAKHLASSEDLNPNIKLLDNRLVMYLLNHEQLENLMDEYHVAPAEPTSAVVKGLLDSLLESEVYEKYVSNETTDFEQDVEFWRDALRSVILPSDLLMEDMEDQSVFWNDDLQIMGTFVLKTLRQIALSGGETIEILPKYKDLEDERFGPDLFRYVVQNQDEYRKYIDMFIKSSNWDTERLAFMDIVIMTTAIAEIIHFPSIPVPVSVNEYVEIANNYSTDKSGGFINGILYSVTQYLKENNIINK